MQDGLVSGLQCWVGFFSTDREDNCCKSSLLTLDNTSFWGVSVSPVTELNGLETKSILQDSYAGSPWFYIPVTF